jgi:type III restriction enzyme
MSAEFKAAAAAEIAEFNDELRQRFPGRDVDELSDEDLLREVMNTVGKPGKLGERVRCVVSVSMLTEGWDASTVSHVLGVRAVGTQLLCEQVVGRGLRRRSSTVGDDGRFEPEYAEVYGVPFSFIPASGSGPDPKPGPIPTRVRAMEDRTACEITFPRLVGYRWEIPDDHLEADFVDESRLALDSRDVPTRTEVAAIVGEAEQHRLERFEAMRAQQVAYVLAKRLLDRYFRAPDEDDQPGAERPWLFPRLVEIAKRWIGECVTLKDDAFIGLLAMAQRGDDAVEKLYLSIVRHHGGERRLVPLLRPYELSRSAPPGMWTSTPPRRCTRPARPPADPSPPPPTRTPHSTAGLCRCSTWTRIGWPGWSSTARTVTSGSPTRRSHMRVALVSTGAPEDRMA